MSYHGTVTCGVCYQRGHNKRSCPEYTRRLQRNFDAYKDGPGRNAYAEQYGQELARRTGIDPWTGKKAAKEERMKKYTCSYCQTEAHTRRSCQLLKEDKAVYAHLTRAGRTQLLKEVEESGIGIGTVIPYEQRVYDHGINEYVQRKDPMFIVSYMWNARGNFTPEQSNVFRAASLKKLGKLGVDQYSGGPAYRKYSVGQLSEMKEKLVIGPPPNMRSKMPKGWLEGADIDYADAFPTGTSRDWQYRYAEDNEHITQARKVLGFDS